MHVGVHVHIYACKWNPEVDVGCLFSCSSSFLKKGLPVAPAVLDSLYRPGWPQLHRDLLASDSAVLGLKLCATVPISILYFESEFLTVPGAHYWLLTRLAGQWAPEIFLSLPSEHLNCRCTLPSLAFYVGARYRTQAFMLVWQALYPQSHLPIPKWCRFEWYYYMYRIYCEVSFLKILYTICSICSVFIHGDFPHPMQLLVTKWAEIPWDVYGLTFLPWL